MFGDANDKQQRQQKEECERGSVCLSRRRGREEAEKG
jgi:hypothetical protein